MTNRCDRDLIQGVHKDILFSRAPRPARNFTLHSDIVPLVVLASCIWESRDLDGEDPIVRVHRTFVKILTLSFTPHWRL